MAGTKLIIGQVTQTEVQEIEPVIERLNGLKELLMIVIDDVIAMKINDEIPPLESFCESWWDKVSLKYGWFLPPSSDWVVDFQNGDILVG